MKLFLTFYPCRYKFIFFFFGYHNFSCFHSGSNWMLNERACSGMQATMFQPFSSRSNLETRNHDLRFVTDRIKNGGDWLTPPTRRNSGLKESVQSLVSYLRRGSSSCVNEIIKRLTLKESSCNWVIDPKQPGRVCSMENKEIIGIRQRLFSP